MIFMEAIKYKLPNTFNENVINDLIENSVVSVTDSLGRINLQIKLFVIF